MVDKDQSDTKEEYYSPPPVRLVGRDKEGEVKRMEAEIAPSVGRCRGFLTVRCEVRQSEAGLRSGSGGIRWSREEMELLSKRERERS